MTALRRLDRDAPTSLAQLMAEMAGLLALMPGAAAGPKPRPPVDNPPEELVDDLFDNMPL